MNCDLVDGEIVSQQVAECKDSFVDSQTWYESEVSFRSRDIVLKGILTSPSLVTVNKRKPGVLLLPGSGPTDRDGNQPGMMTNLLSDIAHELASAGVFSFRFDKRAVGKYRESWPKNTNELSQFFSWSNFTSDVEHAFRFLQTVPGVNSMQCSILGHSEGGLFACALPRLSNPEV